MRKVLWLITCLTVITLASCSKDDDEFGNNAILGSWTLENISGYKLSTGVPATFHPNGVLVLDGKEIEYSISGSTIKIGKGFGNIIRNLYLAELTHHKEYIRELINSGRRGLVEDEEILWEQREPRLANSIPSNMPLTGNIKIKSKLTITLDDSDRFEKTFTFKRTN